MPRVFQFLIFLSVSSLILLGINFFVYKKIILTFKLSSKYIPWVKYSMIIINLILFLGIFLSRRFNYYFFQNLGFYWLGFIFATFCFFVFMSLVGKIFPDHKSALILIAICLSFISFIYSIYNGNKLPKLKTITLNHSNIKVVNAGFSIVHLTDLHLDNNKKSKNKLQYIVDKVNRLKPDVIAITGDLFDEPIKKENGILNILSKFEAKLGVFAVTGNHEHYNGINNFIENLSQTSIKILKNDTKHLLSNIFICGIDDPEISSVQKYLKNDNNLFNNLNKKDFNILLFHRPNHFDNFSSRGIDLQLSGHTHAGQIFPFDLIVNIIYKYPFGLYQRGDSYIYTSCGTGVWGPKMRTFTKSEIVQIILQPSN